MGRLAAALLFLVTLAGCGGDSAPTATPAERRAALDKWRQQADAACERAAGEIAKRGEPIDFVDVDRIVVRAAADLRRAAAAVRGLKMPPGGEPRVRAMHAAMKRLERPLATLEDWSAVGKRDEMVKAIVALREEYWYLQTAAEKAGLSECGRPEHRVLALDGLLAPIYVEEFADLSRRLRRDGRALMRRATAIRDRRDLARFFEQAYNRLTDTAVTMDGMEPPRRAERSAEAFQDVVLYRMSGVYRHAAEQLRERRATVAEVHAHVQLATRVIRRQERRVVRALSRDLRPLPPADPEDDDAGDSVES